MARSKALPGIILLALLIQPVKGEERSVCDFNGDGALDFADYLELARALGTDGPRCDLTGDGRVDLDDYRVFLVTYTGPEGDRSVLRKPLGRQGKADLHLRSSVGDGDRVVAERGDTIQVEVIVEANEERVTQVTLFLTMDERYLELVPVEIQQQGGETYTRAFTQGEWLDGSMLFNDTLGDTIGGGDHNQIPRFQLRYSEWIAKFRGAPQRVAEGEGVVARFRAVVIDEPHDGTTRIDVDVISPTGGETGYFVEGKPGIIYNFGRITELTVAIGQAPEPNLAVTRLAAAVSRDGEPMPDLEISFSRSISGQSLDYRWQGVTDSDGRAEVLITADLRGRFWRVGTAGYYVARAVDPLTGEVVGRWGSIPVPGKGEMSITLPVGGPASIP